MDPVTHGIAGALIGKAFFAKGNSSASGSGPSTNSASTARAAIFAATLGAVFPDIDVFVDAFSHDPLGIARYHRGFTHSFVGLPIFAVVLASLTRAFFLWHAKRSGRETWRPPSFAFLFAIYAAGIASHIILDGFTSFGTRMLNPFSRDRFAWDLLFIVDFIFTALLLVPQLAASVHQGPENKGQRASAMWVFLTVSTLAVWALARGAGFPFRLSAVATASGIFAIVLFLPIWQGFGAAISRARWCQAGFCLSCAYIVACGFAHHAALSRVRAFASSQHIFVENIGAMPLPISFLHWSGLILTPDGVYQSQFCLRDSAHPAFHFFANSTQNRFTEEAAQLEPVRTFLWFARFPMMHFSAEDDRNLVEYKDLRFSSGAGRPAPGFTFGVLFDSEGKMLNYGWLEARGASSEERPPANTK